MTRLSRSFTLSPADAEDGVPIGVERGVQPLLLRVQIPLISLDFLAYHNGWLGDLDSHLK